jgi:fructosamine-3-kinase
MTPVLRRAIEAAVDARDGRWKRLAESAWASTWQLSTHDARHFVKVARHPTMLACEADGLQALAATSTVRVPRVVANGVVGDDAWLVLEWLAISGGQPTRALGSSLARLHRAPTPAGPRGERFGWHRDNWLGATAQANAWCDDWCTFFGERRLVPQLALAAKNGFAAIAREGGRLLDALPPLLAGHASAPSLLHGDLWAGNAATLESGDGVVFDPAVYVGDREADFAMTELFGGFGVEFRRAYEEAWRLDEGYARRRELYNLYHLLNHLNLFGEAYAARTRRTLAWLLATSGH